MAQSKEDIQGLIDQLNQLRKDANRPLVNFDEKQFQDAARYAKELETQIKEARRTAKDFASDWTYITDKIKEASKNLEGNNRHLETAKQAYSRIANLTQQLEQHATQQSNLSIIELRTIRARLAEEKKLLNQQLQLTDITEQERQTLEEKLKLTDEQIQKSTKLIKEEQKLSKIFSDQREMLKGEVEQSIKRNLEAISYGSILKGVYNAAVNLSDKTYQNQVSLGLSSQAAKTMTDNLMQASSTMKNVTFQDAVTSNLELNAQFGTSIQFSNEMVEAQQQMKDLLGLSSQEASKLASYTILTGKKQNDITKAIGKSGDKLLNKKEVLSEVLSIEGQLASQYKNDPKLLAQAVEKTKAIGLSLKQAADASRGLLDFESSIANELEAELLTGKDLNLEKARYLALQGDSAGAAKEMMREVGGLAGFNKMNVLQQDALAKSVGMTTDQLADALRKEEELNKIRRDPNQGSAALQRIRKLEEEGKIEEANQLKKSLAAGNSLDVAEKELSISQQMQKNKDKLTQALTKLVASPAMTALSKTLGLIADALANPVVSAALGGIGAAAAIVAGIGAVRSVVGVIKNMLFGKRGESPNRPMYTSNVGGGGGSASADLMGALTGEGGGEGGESGGGGGIGSLFKKGGWKNFKSIFKKGGLKNLIKGAGGMKGLLKGGLGAVMGGGGGGIASMLLGGEGGGFLDSIMGGGGAESAGGAPTSPSPTASPKPSGPTTKSGKPDMRYKANRVGTTTSKSASLAGDVAQTTTKKGGWFGAIGDFLGGAVKKVGGFVGGIAKKAGGFLSKLNPMTYLKKIFTDKGILKKIITKIPKIGNIANLAMTAYDLYSRGASMAEMKEQGASYQDIGKQLLVTIGDLGGTFLGGMLGTLIGPGPGNILGGVLGGMAGSALAGLIADNVNLEGLGKTVAGIFGEDTGGKTKPATTKPATKVEDAIISGQGPIVKTSAGVFQGRPDDVAILGTKLGAGGGGAGGGGGAEMMNEIRAIRQVLTQILAKEGDITLDGVKVGTALNVAARKLQ